MKLVSLAPFYERLRARVEGLTNEEYLWEPIPGCLTVQSGEAGRFITGGTGLARSARDDRLADVPHR